MDLSPDPFEVAKTLIESVVLETARGRSCADVYIVDRDLEVAFTNSRSAALPWWSRPIVRGLIAEARVPSAFGSRLPSDRVVGIRPLSSDRFVVTIEPKRKRRWRPQDAQRLEIARNDGFKLRQNRGC